jgi:hypothetical protein
MNNNFEGLEKLKEKFPSINRFYEERIFGIGRTEDNEAYIFEACDEYFSYGLSKQDCLELSEFFKALSEYAE